MMNKLWKAGLVAFGMAFLVPSVAPAGMISTFHDPYHQTAPSLFVDAANAPLTVEGFTNSFHKRLFQKGFGEGDSPILLRRLHKIWDSPRPF